MAGSKNKKKTTTKKHHMAKKPIKKNAIKKISKKALRVVVNRAVPKKIRVSPVFQPLLAKLQRRRNEITGQVNHLEQDLREDIADNQNMPGDSADHGSGELNQHLSVTLMENDRIELERIERAILRIESGVYGKCETCEKVIPMPRLKAIPWATRCISCQSRVEGV
jgi:DnaK suppressor protein